MKKVITEKDIEAAATDGRLVVTRDIILTPDARAYAQRRGIEVVYGNDKVHNSQPVSTDELARLIEDVVVQEMSRRQSEPPPAPEPSETRRSLGEGGPEPTIRESAARDPSVDAGVDAVALANVLDAHGRDEGVGPRAIVTVVGADRSGILARFSAVAAECGGNLEDVSQVIIDKYFSMIFIVNLAGLDEKGITFRVFKEKLQDEAARLGGVQVLIMHEDIFKAMHEV